MTKGIQIVFAASLLMMIVFSCSTEKNTFINRNYHSLTAHYNGYYNANELINQSLVTYNDSRIEDYYDLIPINPVPNEKEVVGMYPAIDTAISKCKKVIRNHSMPSNDRPSKKKEEHNRWIDENWTTIGIASYYRRDYEGAMKSFNFVRKFYKNDPSLYVGQLWMAKTLIAQGKYTEAKLNLDNLDKAIADEDLRKEEAKESKKKKSKFSKKKKKDDEIAKVPKSIRFDLEKTKAELALLKDEKKEAIEFLETSLKHARMRDNTERVHFVLGQLYQEAGDAEKAKQHYTKVIKGNARYEMSFNARLKRAFLGGGEKVKKELNKMLKDPKNAAFKDQIYYALAEIAFKEGDEFQGIVYLHKSAFYSTNNTRQKGMAYERLGDLSFSKRKYVDAQKYYDSCATVIDKDTYPNAEAIRNKADNLASLVRAVETAHREDSLQRIAGMDEESRLAFVEGVIEKVKKEEEERKRREAERLLELQENQNLFAEEGSGSKWYWNNAKVRADGYEEFKRLWGQRENEDNWRRSEKTPVAAFTTGDGAEENDSLPQEQPEDTLTVEYMMASVPLSDSALAASNMRLMKAYHDAGVIYKDQLNEPKLAEEQFRSALDKHLQSDPHDLLCSFQMYKLTETSNSLVANEQKNYILNNYPNSDYANYLRDPEYFIKKKERDALAEQEYVRVLDRYDRGLYYPVLTKANQVISEDSLNIYRSKYMLLKAMCLGQLNRDKTKLLPVLNDLVKEFPNTPEADRAREMIDIIENGYSANEPYNFEKESSFAYDDKAKYRVIVFLDKGTSTTSGKTRVSDFNKEFFSRVPLRVDSKLYGKDQAVILIDEFENEMKASSYIRAFRNTKKHLLDISEAKVMMISRDNLKVLFQKMNLEEYETFYEEYY